MDTDPISEVPKMADDSSEQRDALERTLTMRTDDNIVIVGDSNPKDENENQETILNNSSDILSLPTESDLCAEVGKRRQELYVSTHAFSNENVQTLSWLFTYGRLDNWADKVVSFYVVNQTNRDYIPASHWGNNDVSIARLGVALRIPEKDAKRVKFVVAVNSRSSPQSYKLLVSHSKRAAAIDIFYEMLNGHSIVFVGAVLAETAVPVEHPHKQPPMTFKRVGSVEEAEKVGEGVVGFIC